eukprot:6049362-Alexandrium_andersonii.AAC.1
MATEGCMLPSSAKETGTPDPRRRIPRFRGTGDFSELQEAVQRAHVFVDATHGLRAVAAAR